MKRIVLIFLTLSIIFGNQMVSFARELNVEDEINKMKNMPGVIISYTNDGIPVVNVTEENILPRAVYATVISPYGYFYSDSSLKESSLLFSIPRGKTVQVIDSNISDTVAKIQYAGYTGYIRKSNLQF